MALVYAIQNIMTREMQCVLHAIIHARNAQVLHLPRVQAAIQQNTAFLMEVEDVNAWISTLTREVTNFVLHAIISVKHV